MIEAEVSGKVVTESFRLISNESALVESYLTSSGRETVTVYLLDRDRVFLTHCCAQRNQPRLAATRFQGDAVVFRFVDATGVLPDQAVLIEKELRLREDGLEQTEIYRQPDGALERTTFHFARTRAQM